MLEEKPFNRMSIEHILCPPCDVTYNDKGSSTYYGLPSPVTSYQGSDDDDDEDYRYESKQYTESIIPSLHPLYRQRTYSDNSSNLYQLHRRAILPYRRRRTNSSNSDADSLTSSGQTRIPWSPEEDILLKQGYEQGLSWALIASTYLPHRSRGCCWGRFKTLKNKKFLNVQRQIRAKAKPWKTLNPLDMQHYL